MSDWEEALFSFCFLLSRRMLHAAALREDECVQGEQSESVQFGH